MSISDLKSMEERLHMALVNGEGGVGLRATTIAPLHSDLSSFDYSFDDWLLANLRSSYEFCNSIQWKGLFACACWFIWKWRCSAIFDPQFRPPFNPRLSHNGSIAAGGLIRNSDGDWVCGFSANLGVGDIHVAELWALCNGLKMAAGQNVTHILVESDSAVVVNLVKGE
ncbi:hypothetical protein ACLB2K_059816 [Fragaria x ananassa]